MNIIAYLESQNINYYTQGKNVTYGWVNIQCPFCSDHSNHLGINLSSNKFNCWICGEKGYIEKLIGRLENTHTKTKIKHIISEYPDEIRSQTPKHNEPETRVCKLPKHTKDTWEQYHYEYFKNRRFDPKELTEQYNLKYCNNVSNYKFSVVIPIIENRSLVNFSTVNVFTRQYRHCPNTEAAVSMKHCLYNIDSVGESMIVVEGIADVWRIGRGAVATFGIEYTKEQVQKILKKCVRNVFVLFDAEPQALNKAEQLCQHLNTLPGIDKTEMILLPEGDPADMSNEDAKALRTSLFGKSGR